MYVKELMTPFAHTIESSIYIADAAELMRDHNIGLLPIAEGGVLMGTITDRDLVVRGIAEGKDPDLTTVREIMTPRVATVFEDQNIEQALEVMQENHIRRVAVINHDQRLVGILSEADLPARSASSITEQAEPTESAEPAEPTENEPDHSAVESLFQPAPSERAL